MPLHIFNWKNGGKYIKQQQNNNWKGGNRTAQRNICPHATMSTTKSRMDYPGPPQREAGD
jgi:hypothetical protein